MYIPFDEIDFEARLWIYQANRQLTADEVGTLTQSLKAALEGWNAHGSDLLASVKIFEHRFVVIALDEKQELPSGCSIDKSTGWLKELGRVMEIDFFDRSVAWLNENKEVETAPISQISKLVAEEVLLPSTIVFDNLVQTKAQWMSRWKVAADQTWLKRYFASKETTA